MNTRRVNTAADVINAALTQNRTAAGIALALESAQLLMSPETAAELTHLRDRNAAVPAELTSEQCTILAEQLGDAKPARTELLVSFGQSIHDRREHDHTAQREDWYCLNLSAYMGERMAPVLRRLLDAEARVSELETAPTTVYRAAHDSIVMGLYTTAAEARKHCETELRREHAETTKVELWWPEDEEAPEDSEAELYAHITPRAFEQGRTWNTGYVVTPLEVASEYDEGADE